MTMRGESVSNAGIEKWIINHPYAAIFVGSKEKIRNTEGKSRGGIKTWKK